jgi:carbamoyltransferase
MERLLGPARKPGEPIVERHLNLAASVQAMYERAFFHLLRHVQQQTGETRLALAGGCAMNSAANGKISQRTDFDEVYIPPAPGDAGGSVGAAYWVWHQLLGQPRSFVMDRADFGPEYGAEALRSAIRAHAAELLENDCEVHQFADEGELCTNTARMIAEGAIVGWFQGRMEWGPRALGQRSILADPRRSDMRDLLNLKIKLRESFRPFAPAILREATADWFDEDVSVPFMSRVLPINADKRAHVPAVTHSDGTGRLQTVDARSHPRYARLIAAFNELTGVPMLVNTSFNENEPVVCQPAEALDCFLRTQMDVLILDNYMIRRRRTTSASVRAA